ncbi:hypothetical protein [Mycoplasmoides pirum]|uniref:hypothetical protein n=1 Tax=Mycoplasmoides pirum TaxID=2122 RepID=UPI0004821A01|nr:hypothetical protein [Mycoplasmoides pirum]
MNNEKINNDELLNQNENESKMSDVEKSIVDLAEKQVVSKYNNKFFKHLKKFNFLYINILIWSLLIIVIGICIAAGLKLI